MLLLCPNLECWVCFETLSDAQVLPVTLGSGAAQALRAGHTSLGVQQSCVWQPEKPEYANNPKDWCQGWQKLSQKSLTDVQEVEEPGPGMQKGEGHLKVPHFRTGEMLSLQCGLAGLMVNSLLAVVVWDPCPQQQWLRVFFGYFLAPGGPELTVFPSSIGRGDIPTKNIGCSWLEGRKELGRAGKQQINMIWLVSAGWVPCCFWNSHLAWELGQAPSFVRIQLWPHGPFAVSEQDVAPWPRRCWGSAVAIGI